MDVLSDVITMMRTGRPITARAQNSGTWSECHGPFPGAGFHVVLSGSCWLVPVDGAPVALTAGDVVLLPRGSKHYLKSVPVLPADSLSGAPQAQPAAQDTPVDLLCGAYRLDQERTHPLLAEMPAVVHLPASVGNRPSLRAAVDLLGGDLKEAQPGSSAALTSLLDLLLIYIIRAYTAEEAARSGQRGWPAALEDPAIAAVLQSMHEDPAKPWTVQELGARAGLSRAAFARRFSALLGQPPLAYLTWWRLATAARMLRETDAPLASIATRVGYSSQFAFANAFKREFGQAAGGYRKRWREEQQTTAVPAMAG
ncbi:AraC family transcriptional regulator [Streptomyces sp. NPDC094143]|uniref:AraC family transcriptional regulator n=1 Tax=Streptomyces sp. NPDC094143 TaxID=3155310 RepID=UPI003330BF78